MRLNWFSNAPWVNTGYGNQTKIFVPRLQAQGHEISITAFFGLQGGIVNESRFVVYPTVKHPYGQDVIGAHAIHAGAQAVISLLDIWVVQPENIPLPWFPWFPIDCEPIPRNVLGSLKQATKGITISRFGQRMAKQAGVDTFYVPHGIDTKVFAPMGQPEARKMLNLPESAFIVGMVAANKGYPPRKSFFQQIAAFAALKKLHPDALLYLHTDDGTYGGGEAINLIDFCSVMGLKPQKDVIFCDQYQYAIGFQDAYMRAIYSAMDVHMLASMGEGFGIPIVEAQACGCPVIVGDWTSMGELCFSGWKIGKEEAEQTWIPFFNAFQWSVHTGAVADRLFAAYEMRGNQEYRKRARDGALAYDADKVAEKYWKPTLEEIEEIVKVTPVKTR